jgi:hypothetical protein
LPCFRVAQGSTACMWRSSGVKCALACFKPVLREKRTSGKLRFHSSSSLSSLGFRYFGIFGRFKFKECKMEPP